MGALPSAARLARQTRGRAIDVAQFVGEAEGRQARRGGAESVRLQDLRAGLDIFLVNLADQVRGREAELVVAAVDEHPARVQHGPHRAIGHQNAAGQAVTEFRSAGNCASSHGEYSQKPPEARKLRYRLILAQSAEFPESPKPPQPPHASRMRRIWS